MQKVTTRQQTTIQNNQRTCFNEVCVFNKVLPYLYTARILQNIKSVQKQPFADVLQNRCSRQFCKIHRKTRSTFNKVAGLRKLHCKCFLMIFAKFSRTPNKTLYTIKVNYPVPDKIMISKSDTIIQVLCERYIIANQQGIVFPAHLFC